mgnify:CR=1 FL=1
MSLQKCKECQNVISTKSSACPHCGARRTTRATWLGLVAILLFVGGIINVQDKRQAEAASASEPSADSLARKAAISSCRHDIKAQLHDPASAEFDTEAEAHVYRDGDIFTARRSVRAKNAFNATRLTIFECKYRLDGRKLILLSVAQLQP